ncbi:similar to Saccharomyces cerevisiae YHR191C CTF8 Subunit of a complex with Ctf18p that shares some subunits with Replication Factor C and is required for sister chromatid cohesion [Maudiozyma saulgeensis]|uniref:Similar to Saccharomyces cerevisiae YHR191C CTF8 Subunit of a complex with Ctf18p that shares some subunits with Replication Factor C and is required for sister chromatid cohesion n=1 Tax=Maudiozyma saulgeensis TaxID=1789683 RepID=A0A1X7R0G8_9SACH|nr:similar to Saccharomyces cerevisiae YHR191C CTF8 Subunit of a complex with Ctf18p that shares some subunits with Replication Factor C and is required for sister chromatid cohesion [Kazachstania saulgeensis]
MPSTTISVEQITQLLDPEQKKTTVPTAFGNMILEIQGDLDIPDIEPTAEEITNSNTEVQFNTYKGENIIRFGLLNISEDKKHATLYIGKKQRLLGTVVELETPLGLLKFNSQDGQVDLCDIIQYKVLFKDRPLPIM